MKAHSKGRLYQRLKERDGLTCGICKQSLEEEWVKYEKWLEWKNIRSHPKPKAPFKRTKLQISIDHIYPKSRAKKKGWTQEQIWDLSNLQLAHRTCNTRKGNFYAEAEDTTEGSNALREVRPAVLVRESESNVVPRGQEGGLVSKVWGRMGKRTCTTKEKTLGLVAAPSAVSVAVNAGTLVGAILKRGLLKKHDIMTDERPKTNKEIIMEATLAYNEGAKIWNSLPGHRLIWPQDKFAIKYCYCKKADAKPIRDKDRFGNPVRHPYCERCGFALPGAYD